MGGNPLVKLGPAHDAVHVVEVAVQRAIEGNKLGPGPGACGVLGCTPSNEPRACSAARRSTSHAPSRDLGIAGPAPPSWLRGEVARCPNS